MNLETAFRDLYLPQRLLGKSSVTQSHHLFAIDNLRSFLNREPALEDLQDQTIAGLLAWLHSKQLAPRTINNRRAYLLSQWRFYNSKGLILRGPTLAKLAEPEKSPVAFTAAEIAQLLSAAAAVDGTLCGITAGLWWQALIRSLFDTGERIGAALKWELGYLDSDSGVLVAQGRTRKNGRAKAYRLRASTLAAIGLTLTDRRVLFPWPYSQQTLYNHFGRLVQLAGIPGGRDRKFHCLRKSHASYVEASGGDATASLGHANRHTTESYLDPRIARPGQSAALLPEL